MLVDDRRNHDVVSSNASVHSYHQHSSRIMTYLPVIECPRFWGREEILASIDDVLCKDSFEQPLKSIALYGMGGVGKTQIALRYANVSREKFDAIFWVAADTLATINHSFREIAREIGLAKTDIEENDHAVISMVKDWLSSSGKRYLLYIIYCSGF